MTAHAFDALKGMREPARPNGNGSLSVGGLDEARRELETIYELNKIGLTIVGARIVGRGSRASADIYLNSGDQITFESIRDAARPSTLLPELAASVGVTPGIKQPQCLRAVTLLRRIASHQAGFSEDEIARDWGVSYLQAADTLDIDINDQTERWGAFSRLNGSGSRLVLRHTDGSRYVRTGWFYESIRSHGATISAHELAHHMERIGWTRRGKTGRIKATAPGRKDELAWSFYVVPAGWEDEDQ